MPKHYDLTEESADLEALARQVQGLAGVEQQTRTARAKTLRRQHWLSNPLTKGIFYGAVVSIVVMGVLFVAIPEISQAFATKIPVPDVLGLNYTVANTKLVKLGLKVKIEHVQNDSKTPGTIVAIKPVVGTKVTPASEVIISASMKSAHDGKPSATPDINPAPQPPKATELSDKVLPDVEGMIDSKAREKLEDLKLGLTITIMQKEDTSKPDHVVLTCDPKPGTTLSQGAAVSLVVNSLSDAPAPPDASSSSVITVPNYVGRNGEEAVNDLGHLGLIATSSEERSHLQSAGNVIRTSPSAGSQLPPGSEVTVYIAQ